MQNTSLAAGGSVLIALALKQLRHATDPTSAADKGLSHHDAVPGVTVPASLHGTTTDLRFDAANPDPSIVAILRALVPDLAQLQLESISVAEVVGGITNRILSVRISSTSFAHPPLLIRIFGAEGMIDRGIENATTKALADAGNGAPYYGRFGNGRVEGFFDGARDLELPEMADPGFSQRIACALAKLHTFQVPEQLAPWHPAEPQLWNQLDKWLNEAESNFSRISGKCDADAVSRMEAIIAELCTTGSNAGGQQPASFFAMARSEVGALKKSFAGRTVDVVFCHNDALAGNILVNQGGEVSLIDFEYGGFNFRSFDIANHWNEWAGGTQTVMNGQCEYERFPSEAQQLKFCQDYCLQLGNGPVAEDVLAESKMFVGVNHWYWGLWAVNQAIMEGVNQFDYIEYFASRLRQYYATRGVAAAAPKQPANNSAPAPAPAEEEEGVRGSSTHVDLNNLKDSGTGELSAEEFAALRAKTKSAAEVAKNMTPEQQAAYGCKTGVAASAVRDDSDDSDDEGADFGDMGGEGAGALLGDY